MQLARLAAQRALQEWQEQEASPDARPAASPPAKTPDLGLLFTRLSRSVRDSIALEARLAAGPKTQSRGANTKPHRSETHIPGPHDDPRREPLIRVLHEATKLHPQRAEMHRGLIERIDSDLARDPDYLYPGEAILVAITEDLGIDVDYTKLSDEMLAALLPKRFWLTPEESAKAEAEGYVNQRFPSANLVRAGP